MLNLNSVFSWSMDTDPYFILPLSVLDLNKNIFRMGYLCRPTASMPFSANCYEAPVLHVMKQQFLGLTFWQHATQDGLLHQNKYFCAVLLVYFAVHVLGALKHVAVMLLRSTVCI